MQGKRWRRPPICFLCFGLKLTFGFLGGQGSGHLFESAILGLDFGVGDGDLKGVRTQRCQSKTGE